MGHNIPLPLTATQTRARQTTPQVLQCQCVPVASLLACDEPCGPERGAGDQRAEPQLLWRHAKLCQLGLVHADEVVVRLGHLRRRQRRRGR